MSPPVRIPDYDGFSGGIGPIPSILVDFTKDVNIYEIVRAQKAFVESITDMALAERVLRLLDDARHELRDRLSTLDKEKFTAAHYTAALAQTEETIAALVKKNTALFREIVPPLERRGLGDLLQQVDVASRQFKGVARKLPIEKATKFLHENPARRSRMRRFQTTMSRYGAEIVDSVERELAKSMLMSEPTDTAIDRVARVKSSPFDDARWKAERIYRTELAGVYEDAKLDGARWANEEVGLELQKKLVATFDDRTGADSRFVHGQTKPLDEPFEDNRGRKYMKPPNRPNDRETVAYLEEEAEKQAEEQAISNTEGGSGGGESGSGDGGDDGRKPHIPIGELPDSVFETLGIEKNTNLDNTIRLSYDSLKHVESYKERHGIVQWLKNGFKTEFKNPLAVSWKDENENLFSSYFQFSKTHYAMVGMKLRADGVWISTSYEKKKSWLTKQIELGNIKPVDR